MSKSLDLVWIEQEPVRVFSTAHFQSAAAQSGPQRFIQVGEADRAISRLDHLLTIPHGPAPLTQALLRLARGTEMMMPLWMRLFQGVIGHPHFNWQIVRSQ